MAAVSTLRLAPNRAWAGYGGGEPPYQTKYGVSTRFVQSDDKSWELTLPMRCDAMMCDDMPCYNR